MVDLVFIAGLELAFKPAHRTTKEAAEFPRLVPPRPPVATCPMPCPASDANSQNDKTTRKARCRCMRRFLQLTTFSFLSKPTSLVDFTIQDFYRLNEAITIPRFSSLSGGRRQHKMGDLLSLNNAQNPQGKLARLSVITAPKIL